MAVTGLIMVLFLLVHMYGNLKLFLGPAAFDGYALHLRTVGEPYLPYAGALWVVRVVLVASVLIHMAAAFTLWARSRRATGGRGGWRYASGKARRGVQRSYASFTLRWGGIIIVLFVIFHLLQLTTGTVHPGGASPSSYRRTVTGFQNEWVVAVYTLALLAIGLHIRHGIWSACASLGANTSARRRRVLGAWAIAGSLVITVGFLVPPYAVVFGGVK
jgi:succinate dehydrogenase / fumarate reductase cytochrome b subunit